MFLYNLFTFGRLVCQYIADSYLKFSLMEMSYSNNLKRMEHSTKNLWLCRESISQLTKQAENICLEWPAIFRKCEDSPKKKHCSRRHSILITLVSLEVISSYTTRKVRYLIKKNILLLVYIKNMKKKTCIETAKRKFLHWNC